MVKTNTIKALLSSNYNLNNLKDEYIIFAYALNNDIVSEDGSTDNLFGCVIPLGSVDLTNKNKAEEEKNIENYLSKLMRITNHRHYMVVKTGKIGFLEKVPDVKIVDRFIFDQDDKIIKIENSEKNLEKKYEERRNEIKEEQENETIPGSFDEYKRNLLNCLFCYQNYEIMQEKSQKMYDKFLEMRSNLLNEENKSYREDFLPILKDRMIERGEKDAYGELERIFLKNKDKIFPENLIEIN